MIRLWAILFGLAVAIAAGMVVKAAFAKASNQFRSHAVQSDGLAASDDLKTSFHSARLTKGAQQNHG